MRMRAALLLAAWSAMPLAAQETPVRILPATPQAGEAFAIIGTYGFNRSAVFASTTARREGSVIEVSQPQVFGSSAPNRWSRYGATVAGLEAGTYTVRAGHFLTEYGVYLDGTPPVDLPITVVPGTAAQPLHRDLDGNWFDPAQPGWGINLVQGESGALLAIWLTYGELFFSSGRALESEWIAMPAGRWTTPTTHRGLLYQSAGTRLGQSPVDSDASPVGLGTIEILGPDRMRFSFIRATIMGTWFEGRSTLQRFAF